MSRKVSLERAQNVAHYITDRLGCNVTAMGRGKSYDPPNTTEENKQQNRRVDLKIGALELPAAVAELVPAKTSKRKPK